MSQTTASERRTQRAAKTRQRELARQLKEEAKLSELEAARLHVEEHENRLDVLLSIHKQESPPIDWQARLDEPPPLFPVRLRYDELFTRWQIAAGRVTAQENASISLAEAVIADDHRYRKELLDLDHRHRKWEQEHQLAKRVLAGEAKAYVEALTGSGSFEEIAELGSSLRFTVHSHLMVECHLKVNGHSAIPAESKSLTASGRLSIKPIPRARFHELYQDYVCSCILRVGREVFAILPISMLLIHACIGMVDSATGQDTDQVVLSVALPRQQFGALDFQRIDPSDAVESFRHRGDFRATRKEGAFAPIVPLSPDEAPVCPAGKPRFQDRLESIEKLRSDLKTALAGISSASSVGTP